MFADWIAREGWMVLSWWLLATLAGVAVLPLCTRLLGNLPDRGYTLARPIGILLVAFTFWLLATFGLLRNDAGNIALAWVIVLGASLMISARQGEPQRHTAGSNGGWWRATRGGVLVGEVIFVILLVSWAWVRAHNNNLTTTEKPMDLALMASIMRGETFPPADPWLSGFSISYYYFGYVMGAMFSTASGVVATTGYNLWTALLMALAGQVAYGVAFNMVRSRAYEQDEDALTVRRSVPYAGVLAGLLATYLMVIAGNYQTPLVDVPYFSGTASQEYLDFWDVRQRQTARPPEQGVAPEQWGYWWWFRSARVIHDRNLSAMPTDHEEAINEFPMFSFLLADNHPHVMSLPFSILAMGLALNIILSSAPPTRRQTVFYGLCVGALVFLNTWDSPIYIMVLVGAEALRRLRARGSLEREDWVALFQFGGALLALTLIAYAPFLIGFRSQLGGILPNVIHPTRFSQYLLVFGAGFLICALFVLVEFWRAIRAREANIRLGAVVALASFAGLTGALLLFVVLGMLLPETRNFALFFIESNGGWGALLPEIAARRLTHGVTTALLLIGIALIVARLFPRRWEKAKGRQDDSEPVSYPPANGLALMFVGAALTLTLIPEFVYLRDNFGHRMNTIFKFYYQAWALFAVAGAYGVYTLLDDYRLPLAFAPVRAVMGVGIAGLLALGAFFPVIAIPERALIETGIRNDPARQLTLDGGRTLTGNDDYAVLVCLRDLVGRADVVVLEATHAGSYDYMPGGIGSGRLAGITGLPTVLGWQGHQSQWRGSAYRQAVGTRPDDVARIYQDLRLDAVQPLIEAYQIDFILFGSVERNRYGIEGELKFLEAFDVVCESGGSRVFRTRRIDPLVLRSAG